MSKVGCFLKLLRFKILLCFSANVSSIFLSPRGTLFGQVVTKGKEFILAWGVVCCPNVQFSSEVIFWKIKCYHMFVSVMGAIRIGIVRSSIWLGCGCTMYALALLNAPKSYLSGISCKHTILCNFLISMLTTRHWLSSTWAVVWPA